MTLYIQSLPNLSKNLSSDHSVVARVAGPEADVLKILQSVRDIESVVPQGLREEGAYEYLLIPKENADIRRAVFERLAERGRPLLELRSNELTLEQIFLRLTDATAAVVFESKDTTEDTPLDPEDIEITLPDNEAKESEDVQ